MMNTNILSLYMIALSNNYKINALGWTRCYIPYGQYEQFCITFKPLAFLFCTDTLHVNIIIREIK